MKYIFVKIFWFFGNPIKKFYWFVFRPKTFGVKCIVENSGKFLFVKLNYAHHKWTIPGGGVGKGESFLNASIREVQEETGIKVNDLVRIGSYVTSKEYKEDTVEIFYCNSDTIETKIDPVEIERTDWFTRANFPENRSTSVDKIFKIYDEFKSKTNS